MHYLIDLDNTLLDAFYTDENGKEHFYWVENFENDFGINGNIFEELFDNNFITALFANTEINDYIIPFIEKHKILMTSDELLEYWLSRDARLNLDVFEWIKNKKQQGHYLHIASNQPHIRMNYLWNKFSEWHILFDEVFTSAKIGIAKPEKGFFEYVKKELGIPYCEMVLIDDCPKNFATAKELGMQAVLFNSIEDVRNI